MNSDRQLPANREVSDRLTVIASLIIIFAFSAVDLAISPLVKIFGDYYSIPTERILWLISYCTLGIVIGVFIGPAITATFKVRTVSAVSALVMASSLALFLIVKDFYTALFLRVLFGLSVGVLSTVMWWLAYHGVTEKFMHPMITVMMAARPLAVALGVPITGMISMNYGWRNSFILLLGIIAFSSLILYKSMPRDSDEKQSFRLAAIINSYVSTLKMPYAFLFFLGLFINKICYFGFYSMAGIWFMKIYGLTPFAIAGTLLYIGLAEAGINFVIPFLIKMLGQKRVFAGSIILGGIIFALLFRGTFSLNISIVLFALFAMMDRIYSMAMVVKLPDMFRECENKTVLGSMVTLSSWTSLMGISWIEGEFLKVWGIHNIGMILLVSFIAGSGILWWVQIRSEK